MPDKIKVLYNQNKKVFYTISIAFLILVLVLTFTFVFNGSEDSDTLTVNDAMENSQGNNSQAHEEQIVYVESPVNGLKMPENVYEDKLDQNVIAVMIQNHVDSRPQYGLNEADVVYEALAEGDITRFMGVYWLEDADKVMSVRSSRKYYIDILGDYGNPVFMHIGQAEGAPEVNAVMAVNNYGVRDVPGTADSFDRDPDCEAVKNVEHCAYTSIERIREIAKNRGWESEVESIEKLSYRDKEEGDTQITNDESEEDNEVGGENLNNQNEVGQEEDEIASLKNFSINFTGSSSPDYIAYWRYNETEGKYYRYNADRSIYEDGNGKPVSSNVIVFQNINSYYNGDPEGRRVQQVIGEGEGYVMQDGMVYPISWSKDSFSDRTTFIDATTDQEFKFRRGKMWVSWVPNGVNYTEESIGEEAQIE